MVAILSIAFQHKELQRALKKKRHKLICVSLINLFEKLIKQFNFHLSIPFHKEIMFGFRSILHLHN